MDSTTQNTTIMLTPADCRSFILNDLKYHGVFYNQNPMDHIIPTLMLQIILSVVFSRIIHSFLKPLKQSRLVSNILAGVILGPSVLGLNKTYVGTMLAAKETVVSATIAQMAIFLYLFVSGIKAEVSMLIFATKKSLKLGLCCIGFPLLFTMLLALVDKRFTQELTPRFIIEFGLASSLSYFTVITRALDELNLLTSELGQLSASITCLNEVVSIIYVTVAIALGQKDPTHSVYAILSMVSVTIFAIYVIRPALFWIIRNTPKGEPVKECYVTAILITTCLMGFITSIVGGRSAAGFALMGFIIPEGPPLGTTIIQKCELLLFEFFMPLFFVRIGFAMDLWASWNYKEIMIYGALNVVPYLGRLAACLLFSSSMKMKKTDAVSLSLILSLQGIVELYQIDRMRPRVLEDRIFALNVVCFVVLNVIATPIIATLNKPVVEKNGASPNKQVRLANKSLGKAAMAAGELQIIACVQEEQNVPCIISLLEAMSPKDVNPICVYVVHLVAVPTQTVPILAPYKNHLRKFSQPSGSDNIIRAFLNYAEGSQGLVEIQPHRLISPYKYMHEHICRLGENKNAPLIIVPFFKRNEANDTNGTFRIFNTNIQAVAKCTVGLLVDRGRHSTVCLTTFSYNMAVIFFGGVDDREVLALATRASHHPNVSITVLRIETSGNHHHTFHAEIEKTADDTLYRDFKAMNTNNGNVICVEIVAHGVEDVMKAIRSLSKPYDLLVVGKRHDIPELKSLTSWVKYPELGEIGDAVAEPEFMRRRMSVLVLQHHSHDNRRISIDCNYFSCLP